MPFAPDQSESLRLCDADRPRKRILTMRITLVFFALSLLASTAPAQRPSTLAMSCADATALVASAGSIVLSTGPHTYDRFVSHGRFCSLSEHLWPANAPTADTRRCPLGFVCRPGRSEPEDFWYGPVGP
jgi:hypothetical protein